MPCLTKVCISLMDWMDVSVHTEGANDEELTLLQTICVSVERQTAGQVGTNAQGHRCP